MKSLYIIFSPQEYDSANHKFLWESMADNFKEDFFLVINIPADQIIARIKGKKDRIIDSKNGIKALKENLWVLRPLYFIRPEILPSVFDFAVSHQTLKTINKYIDLDTFDAISVISYTGIWIKKLIKYANPKIKFFYYLLDEVRLDADSGKINKKRTYYDEYACKNSEIIFAMSQGLADDRCSIANNIIVIGNGAKQLPFPNTIIKYPKSCAFVGNFRSWINRNLLSSIIRSAPSITFYFVGNVEDDMKDYLDSLLLLNNVRYLGRLSKDEAAIVYRQFDSIIIPYIQNDFMYKTRPIKIVESVFCGTPVVSIPVSGYVESDFIKFATTPADFVHWIEYFATNKPSTDTNEYKSFISNNSWDNISKLIISNIRECYN